MANPAHKTDPLDVRSMAERWLAAKGPEPAKDLLATFRDHPATALETAAEYGNAGLWQDGTDVLLADDCGCAGQVQSLTHGLLLPGLFCRAPGQRRQRRPSTAAWPSRCLRTTYSRSSGRPSTCSAGPWRPIPQDAARPTTSATCCSTGSRTRPSSCGSGPRRSIPLPDRAPQPGRSAYVAPEGRRCQAKAIASLEKAVSLPTRVRHPLRRAGRALRDGRHGPGEAAGPARGQPARWSSSGTTPCRA